VDPAPKFRVADRDDGSATEDDYDSSSSSGYVTEKDGDVLIDNPRDGAKAIKVPGYV
jgi:hypothetical protein